MNALRMIPALMIAFALGSCAPGPTRSCDAGKPFVQTQLYFGMNRLHGTVSEMEWQGFVRREIAPRFQEGFTVVPARGFWLGEKSQRLGTENSRLVLRVHANTPEQEKAIGAIIADYKKEFAQESVLRVDLPVCAVF